MHLMSMFCFTPRLDMHTRVETVEAMAVSKFTPTGVATNTKPEEGLGDERLLVRQTGDEG